MPGPASFTPRNDAVAKRVIFGLTLAGSLVSVAFTLLSDAPATASGAGVTLGVCALLMGLATALMVSRRPLATAWAGFPFLTVAAIALDDLSSHDASVVAQVFFFFPVLYAGSQLRRRAVALVCAASIAAVAVVDAELLPGGTALANTVFVGTALAAAATLLVVSTERTDRLIAQLERLAAVDSLTGLATRRVLEQALVTAIDAASAAHGVALLLLDVDHFKQVNDGLGHQAGDAVLQQLAALLGRLGRPEDVIGRFGGDEIALLMPACSPTQARRRAEEIVLEVRLHEFDTGTAGPIGCSVSVGIGHLPGHAHDVRSLYAAADASLYAAKRAGRDRVGCAPAAPVG